MSSSVERSHQLQSRTAHSKSITPPSPKRLKLMNDNDDISNNERLLPHAIQSSVDMVVDQKTSVLDDAVSPVVLTQDSEASSSSNSEPPSPTSDQDDEQRRSLQDLLKREANFDCTSEQAASSKKRSNYLSWDDYFMAIAALSAQRSKDPFRPSGACIVDGQNRVIGIGYSGFPQGCSDDALPWRKMTTDENGNNSTPWLHTLEPYACAAEVNAILNKCSHDTMGATMYVDHFPRNECAKMIIQSQIKQVVYRHDLHHDEDSYRASRILFEMAGVETRQYAPTTQSSILLDFRPSMAPSESSSKPEATTEAPTASTALSEQAKYRSLLQREARGYDPVSVGSTKRTNYLSWDDYFMAMAFLTAKRSKDPNTQVGACIVHPHSKRILGLGYNGFPRDCSDDVLPWARTSTTSSSLHTKYPYVCHAEVNAILNKGSSNVQGATLYVALFPCNDCAKTIIQAGIRSVVYLKDPYHDTDTCRASRILFEMAGVQTRHYVPRVETVIVEF